MTDLPSPQIGPVVHRLRKERSLTLDALAQLSGVSRSMLSQIERSGANPTIATVWALARALNIDISDLVGGMSGVRPPAIDVASAAFTPEIRTEDGQCTLRILSPADHAERLEWYDLTIEAGGSLVSDPHARGTREHLTCLAGTLEVEAGEMRAAVGIGATARYAADITHAIRNRSDAPARALLVVIS